jgi:polar amino acid transport system substrate-binding protein
VKGSIQGVVADSPVAVEYTAKKYADKIKIAGVIKSDKVENIGIAVKKGNKEVLDLVNKGLAAIKADGTFDKIKAAHKMQ